MKIPSLEAKSPYEKLEKLEISLQIVFSQCSGFSFPRQAMRDLEIVTPKCLPDKGGLSDLKGRARMLHDLANIEMQAMELGLRTLAEFPEAAEEFRDELKDIVVSEGLHLRLCLESLEATGFSWGDWSATTTLWDAVGSEDSLLDRILIVHRYLEGSGLDAGEKLLRRLAGAPDGAYRSVIRQIVREEVDHVAFGSRWYQVFCKKQGIDPSYDFSRRFLKLVHKLPRRMERPSLELRTKAGFTSDEIAFLESYRVWIQKNHRSVDPGALNSAECLVWPPESSERFAQRTHEALENATSPPED